MGRVQGPILRLLTRPLLMSPLLTRPPWGTGYVKGGCPLAFLTRQMEILRHLRFCDYMIAHPAATHPTDIEAYMDGKDAFK